MSFLGISTPDLPPTPSTPPPRRALSYPSPSTPPTPSSPQLVTPSASPSQLWPNIFAMASSALHPRPQHMPCQASTDVGPSNHRRSRSREFWANFGWTGSAQKMQTAEEVEDEPMDIDETDSELLRFMSPLGKTFDTISVYITRLTSFFTQMLPLRCLSMLRYQRRHPSRLLPRSSYTHYPYIPTRPVLFPPSLAQPYFDYVTRWYPTRSQCNTSDDHLRLGIPGRRTCFMGSRRFSSVCR